MIRRLLENRMLRNIATLQVGGSLVAISNLVASIGVAHVLGARDQGLLIVAIQLYSLFFFLVGLGLVTIVVSEIASASARGEVGRVATWLGFLVKCHLGLTVILVVGGWFLLPWATDVWRSYSPNVDPRVATWAWWLTFMPLVDLPRTAAYAAFQGTRRMVAFAKLENGMEVARVFLVIGGAILTGSPAGAVLGTLATTAVGSVVGIELYRRARRDEGYPLPGVRAILAAIVHAPLRRGLWMGLRLGVMRQLDAVVVNILPPLFIINFTSAQWVTYFRIARSIMNLPRMFLQGISRTLLPALAELKGLRDEERFRRTYLRVSLIGGGLVSVGILACLPFVRPVVGLLFPADYAEPVWRLALILALAYVISSFAVSLNAFYLLTGQLGIGVAINLVAAIFGVGMTFYLCWRLPETGAAWGQVCSLGTVILHYVYIPWYFHRRRRAG